MKEGKAKSHTAGLRGVPERIEEEDLIAEADWPAEELPTVGVVCGTAIASNVETYLEDKSHECILCHLRVSYETVTSTPDNLACLTRVRPAPPAAGSDGHERQTRRHHPVQWQKMIRERANA